MGKLRETLCRTEEKLRESTQTAQSTNNAIIAFLVINKMGKLPELAINSVLKNSNNRIAVGYIRDSDIENLPTHPRMEFIKIPISLNFKDIDFTNQYLPFSKQEFFILVTYKWVLFKMLLERGDSHIIYSDSDVLWFSDVASSLEAAHKSLPGVKVLIQSATVDPGVPQLCMGLISMIDSEEVRGLIDTCFLNHQSRAGAGEMVGDDDVITDYYHSNYQGTWIRELPQSTYPVGMLLNTVKRSSPFPGLTSPRPALFHANYVVGLSNKLLLLSIANSLQSEKSYFLDLRMKQKAVFALKCLKQWRRSTLLR
jgi:hypothetical protein